VATLIIEMMRLCPKCGDYYADGSLAFCLVDGTPLVNVNSLSERWSEGARVLEGKENALRKQKRRLKGRRVLMTAMTMLITTLVVCVVAINSFIYLKPKPEEVVVVKPLTQTSEPAEPSGSILPSTPDDSAPTPDTTTPITTPTTSASPRRKDANVHTNVNTNVNTNTNTNANISTSTGINTNTNVNTHVNVNSNTNTNSNANTNTGINVNINTNSDTRPTVCSDADKSREREIIIKRFGDRWRRNIEGERSKVIATNAPAGIDNAEASLGTIEYQITFLEACLPGFVKARYVWQIRTNINGTIRMATVAKEKRFTCMKLGGVWFCR
jgi:hypothetical protein